MVSLSPEVTGSLYSPPFCSYGNHSAAKSALTTAGSPVLLGACAAAGPSLARPSLARPSRAPLHHTSHGVRSPCGSDASGWISCSRKEEEEARCSETARLPRLDACLCPELTVSKSLGPGVMRKVRKKDKETHSKRHSFR